MAPSPPPKKPAIPDAARGRIRTPGRTPGKNSSGGGGVTGTASGKSLEDEDNIIDDLDEALSIAAAAGVQLTERQVREKPCEGDVKKEI